MSKKTNTSNASKNVIKYVFHWNLTPKELEKQVRHIVETTKQKEKIRYTGNPPFQHPSNQTNDIVYK